MTETESIPENSYSQFQLGDKVKTVYGKIRTIIQQEGCRVFVLEEAATWYHPSNLMKIEEVSDERYGNY